MASMGWEKTGKRWRVFWHVTLTNGEIEIGARVCLGVSTFGISEFCRHLFCRNWGKYPPPDVDPNTGFPISMEQPAGQPVAQLVAQPVAQPVASVPVTPENNGAVYGSSYTATPQSMAADGSQGNYGYSSYKPT